LKELLLKLLTSDTFLTGAGTFVGAAVYFFLRSRKAEKREGTVDKAAEYAFKIVNDVAKLTPNKIDDKVALGLKSFHEYLATHKVTATEDEVARAKLVFKALHGDEK
jgi:hypothetical protein